MGQNEKNITLNPLTITFIVGSALLLYFFKDEILTPLIPFLLSSLLAFCLQKPLNFLYKTLKINKKIGALLLIILSVGVIVGVLFFLFRTFFVEFYSLYLDITENESKVLKRLIESEKIKDFFVTERGFFTSKSVDLVIKVIEKFFKFASSIIDFLPKVFLFFSIFLISSYYMLVDFPLITRHISDFFGEVTGGSITRFKEGGKRFLSGYVRTYFTIFFVNFSIFFLSFVLMKVRYSFLLSLVVSLIDILPIFASSVVILPWIIYEFFANNLKMAISLAITLVISVAVREFLEYKLIGSATGVHPILSILAIALGYSFMGFWGVFLFPLILTFLCNIHKTKK